MRFIVTGGAGFIGSHIAQRLLELDRGDVVVLDNLSVGKRRNVPSGARFHICDIRDSKKLSGFFKAGDFIFHNAAFVSIRGSYKPNMLREEIETNELGTLNVLEAAVKRRVQKMIFASSMAVYGHPQCLPVMENHPVVPLSPYGMSKLRGELFCQIYQRHFGLKTVVLRYFNTYGIRQTPSDYVGVMTTFIQQALENKSLTIFGNGQQTRDFVAVEDIVQANVLSAFSSVCGVYNVASGQDLSINKLASLIMSHFCPAKKSYKTKPSGEITRIIGGISKIKKDLHYSPKGQIEKEIPYIIEWWKRNKKP